MMPTMNRSEPSDREGQCLPQAHVSASASPATDADVHAQIEAACHQACQAIAPAWPLDRAIAVNPHWSRIGMPLRRVAARMAVLASIQSPGRSEIPPRVVMNSGNSWCIFTSTGLG